MITEYKIVKHHNDIGLADQVNQAISQGWEVYGHPTATVDEVWQAMVKKTMAKSDIPNEADSAI